MSVIDMRCRGYMTRFGAAVFAAALVSPVHSASNLSTSERLDRIERQLEGRGLIDLLNQLEKLQGDVQQLRGEIEVQNHQLEEMQRRQKDLYLDIDRRLRQLEPEQPAGAAGVAPVPGGADVSAPPAYQAPPSYQPPPSYETPPSYQAPSSYETPSPVAAPPVMAAPPPVAPAPRRPPSTRRNSRLNTKRRWQYSARVVMSRRPPPSTGSWRSTRAAPIPTMPITGWARPIMSPGISIAPWRRSSSWSGPIR